MKFILDLSFWQGVILTTAVVALSGLLVIRVAKKYLGPHVDKQHEKIGRLLFRVTAGLIAFLISLSYANERVAQSKIIDALETEASLLGSTVVLLREIDIPEAERIEKKLTQYVMLTVEDNWASLDKNPYLTEGPEALREAYSLALGMKPQDRTGELIQNKLLANIDGIMQLMQVRVYSYPLLMPNLIYVLCVGIFFMWIFYTVYTIDKVSLGFITLYNVFLGVLLYFVFALSNPLAGPLKVKAHAFEIVQEKGIELQTY